LPMRAVHAGIEKAPRPRMDGIGSLFSRPRLHQVSGPNICSIFSFRWAGVKGLTR
jgi:hypothetical protein